MSALEEIKARAEKATEGPWFAYMHWGDPETEGTEHFAIDAGLKRISSETCTPEGKADADFIAHARTDIPKLVAALEAVEAMLAENATQHRAVANLLNQQVLDREPHRDPEAASRYANYAVSWEAAQRMAHTAITEALA